MSPPRASLCRFAGQPPETTGFSKETQVVGLVGVVYPPSLVDLRLPDGTRDRDYPSITEREGRKLVELGYCREKRKSNASAKLLFFRWKSFALRTAWESTARKSMTERDVLNRIAAQGNFTTSLEKGLPNSARAFRHVNRGYNGAVVLKISSTK